MAHIAVRESVLLGPLSTLHAYILLNQGPRAGRTHEVVWLHVDFKVFVSYQHHICVGNWSLFAFLALHNTKSQTRVKTAWTPPGAATSPHLLNFVNLSISTCPRLSSFNSFNYVDEFPLSIVCTATILTMRGMGELRATMGAVCFDISVSSSCEELTTSSLSSAFFFFFLWRFHYFWSFRRQLITTFVFLNACQSPCYCGEANCVSDSFQIRFPFRKLSIFL